jgi:hypothetical protein
MKLIIATLLFDQLRISFVKTISTLQNKN